MQLDYRHCLISLPAQTPNRRNRGLEIPLNPIDGILDKTVFEGDLRIRVEETNNGLISFLTQRFEVG